MSRRLLLLLISVSVLAFPSCGSEGENGNAESIDTNASGHGLSQEQVDAIISDTKNDLTILDSMSPQDTSALEKALMGTALSDMRETITREASEGKFRKRVYDNISARLEAYTYPYAQVFVEFTDRGYFIDANSGATLEPANNERKTYSLSMVEENGRWKISGIYVPNKAP